MGSFVPLVMEILRLSRLKEDERVLILSNPEFDETRLGKIRVPPPGYVGSLRWRLRLSAPDAR